MLADGFVVMELFSIKRAYWPSFFVCLGILICILVAASQDYLGLWLGVCCLLVAWVSGPGFQEKFTLFVMSLIFLMLLIIINLIFLNHHALPVAYFLLAYGVFGFIICS